MEKRPSAITTIGITGTIGSGKSTVGKILQEFGIPVIDSDELVHSLLASDKVTQSLVIQKFGPGILSATPPPGSIHIDRKALGKIIFNDKQLRTDLEQILHPRVRIASRAKMLEYAKDPKVKLVAALIPLLFEANLGSEYDQTWAVCADPVVLKNRLRQRDGFSEAELEGRLASQWAQEKKASLADKVIDNSGDLAETRRQVLALVNALLAAHTSAKDRTASESDGV